MLTKTLAALLGLALGCAASVTAQQPQTEVEVVEPTCALTVQTLGAIALERMLLAAKIQEHIKEPAHRIVLTQQIKAINELEKWIKAWRAAHRCDEGDKA